MTNKWKCAVIEFGNDLYQEPVNNNGNGEGEDEDPRKGTEAANLGKKKVFLKFEFQNLPYQQVIKVPLMIFIKYLFWLLSYL